MHFLQMKFSYKKIKLYPTLQIIPKFIYVMTTKKINTIIKNASCSDLSTMKRMDSSLGMTV